MPQNQRNVPSVPVKKTGEATVGSAVQDRNADGSVDPFHVPAELADGLGGKSLPRPYWPDAPLRCELTFPRVHTSDAGLTRIGFSAPPEGSGGLGGQARRDCKDDHTCVNLYFRLRQR